MIICVHIFIFLLLKRLCFFICVCLLRICDTCLTIYTYIYRIYIYILYRIKIQDMPRHPWRNGNAPAPDTQGPGFDSWRVSIFSIISLLPFFCAAIAKRWKVYFDKGRHNSNNYVDSKSTYNYKNCFTI